MTVRRPSVWAYSIAAAGVLVFLLTYVAVRDGGLRTFLTSIELFVTIVAAGVVGGWKPSLAATLLMMSGLKFFFYEPRYTFYFAHPPEALRILAFTIIGAAISFLAGGL